MKKMLFIAGIALYSTNLVGNQLDELGDIQLVDESEKSSLFQKGKIVGCTDFGKKKELSCSKKPEEAILSQLPTSQQLDEKDLDNEEDSNEIKEQLKTILAELSALKEKQKANKNTITELRSLVKVLSNKKPIKAKEKLRIVKKAIKKIQPKKSKVYKQTLIRKPIKEVEVFEDHVVIEVQNNESLSTYAQVYYNDNTQYYRIYKANKGKINKNLQIIIGDRLIIPGAHSYKESF